jgi:hypothetical protein
MAVPAFAHHGLCFALRLGYCTTRADWRNVAPDMFDVINIQLAAAAEKLAHLRRFL